MKKHDLLKDGNNTIRVLAIQPDKILMIDCIKRTMPVWVASSTLDSFAQCTGEGLIQTTNFTVTDIDALDAEQRKVMYDRYTLIAPILPFIEDEGMRSKVIIFIWLTGLIGALIFGLIGRTMARSLSQPLANMAKLADRLRFGEKNIRFDHKGVIEMEMLSESLNHMVQSLTQAEDRLIKLEMIAHHDALTGLANRIGLDAFLVHAQALVERQQNMSLGILYLDLDGFKQVNDTYGHPMGDQVLIESAKRLKHCVRTEEFVARIGGDEFVIGLFLKTDKERNMIHAVGQRIITEIGKVFLLNGATINIGCSVGAAIWHPGMSIEQVMKKADDALYRVKKSGKNRLEIL